MCVGIGLKSFSSFGAEFSVFQFAVQTHKEKIFAPVTLSSSFLRFLDHTQRHITVGRTPLDERSDHSRDLYAAIRNTRNTNIHATMVFEPTFSAGEWQQTYTLHLAAAGTSTTT